MNCARGTRSRWTSSGPSCARTIYRAPSAITVCKFVSSTKAVWSSMSRAISPPMEMPQTPGPLQGRSGAPTWHRPGAGAGPTARVSAAVKTSPPASTPTGAFRTASTARVAASTWAPPTRGEVTSAPGADSSTPANATTSCARAASTSSRAARVHRRISSPTRTSTTRSITVAAAPACPTASTAIPPMSGIGAAATRSGEETSARV